jgi:DNA-binding transcriptional ArsR family regulator
MDKILNDDLAIKNLAQAARAYNHTLRLKILNALAEQPLTVKDLFIKFRLEQSVASQQLAILRRADLVRTEPRGKYIIYSVNTTAINQLKNLAQHWDDNTTPQPSRPVVPPVTNWESTDALRKELFKPEPVGAM